MSHANTTPGRPSSRHRAPVVVPDLGRLEQSLSAYVDDKSLSKSTRNNHAKWWRWWGRHCERVGERHGLVIDPLEAPYLAYAELFTEFGQSGALFTVGTVDNIVAAVLARYHAAGLVPAHKSASNCNDWRTLRRGATLLEAERRGAGEVPQKEVVPLLREPLATMLVAKMPSSLTVDARIAAALIALDTGLPAVELSSLLVNEVVCCSDGSVQILGHTIPCDHAERARGVPWDCTACAVRAVLAQCATGLLLGAAAADLPDLVRSWRAGWSVLEKPIGKTMTTVLAPRAEITTWQLAGLRRGLVVTAGGRYADGYRWLRARAWVCLSWVAGFRMGSDLADLPRTRVDSDPAGKGYRIRLGGTKDDPSGEKEVVRALPWSKSDGPSAAQAVAEYLCVLDAARGVDDGPLFRRGLFAPDSIRRESAYKVATQDLELLCEFAGIPAIYSSYSTRKGSPSRPSWTAGTRRRFRKVYGTWSSTRRSITTFRRTPEARHRG